VKLIIGLLLVVSVNAYSQTALNLLVPSPIGVALSIGSWIIKDREKVYKIQVESVAATDELARKEAFKVAIDNAVGSLVLSESTIVRGRVDRNEIIQYSSGYVTKYDVVSRTVSNNQVRLVIDVYVSHSLIANRLLNSSQSAEFINGPQYKATASTIQQQSSDGDKIVNAVLNDFPTKAFVISDVAVKLVRNNDRSLAIHIPYKMEWSKDYVRSIGEVIVSTTEKADFYDRGQAYRIVARHGLLFQKIWEAWTLDSRRYQLFYDKLGRHNPMIMVSVKNANNKTIDERCVDVGGPFVETVDRRIIIDGNYKESNNILVLDNINEDRLEEYNRLTISVVNGFSCSRGGLVASLVVRQ